MELNQSIKRLEELEDYARRQFNLDDMNVLNDAILCVKWYIDHQNDLEDIKAEIKKYHIDSDWTEDYGEGFDDGIEYSLDVIDKHISGKDNNAEVN